LRHIGAALVSLEEGAFWICLECEDEIPADVCRCRRGLLIAFPNKRKRIGGRRKVAMHPGLTKIETGPSFRPGMALNCNATFIHGRNGIDPAR
jgi:hypothetical protein